MESDVLLREDRNGVAMLTLNRPDQMNALSPELILALGAAVEALATDDGIGCVVLRGAGPAFCAGYDLKSRDRARQMLPDGYTADMLSRWAAMPKPVIAAVHGICFTGGMELALAADFIVCGEAARFADTHQRWAMRAAWGLTQRLPRRVGAAMAKELMMTGREIGGREAERIGLVTRCVDDQMLEGEIAALAQKAAGFDTGVLCWIKQQIDHGQDVPLAEGLAHERSHRPAVTGATDDRLKASGWKQG